MRENNKESNFKLSVKRQSCYRHFVVAFGAFLLAYIAASAFAPVGTSDAQEVTIENNVTGYYVTVSNSDDVNLSVNSVATGAYAAAKDTINVKTNAPTGYQLYISAASSDLYNNEDTEHSGLFLAPVNGSLDKKNTLSLNTWGFSLDDASTDEKIATSIWAAVPDDGTELIDETSAPDEAGVDTDIYFGVRVSSALASGTYGTTVYYTAVAEGATEPFMQEFTTAECSAMTTDSTVRLMDIRNQKIYTIVKARDGNCWMAENLQIDNVVINSADSNIPKGTTFTIPESSDWTGNIYNEAKLHIATNSGYEGEHYYNWCSAVAMDDCSTTEQVNQSICPKGWRLPINGDATQDKSYAKLMNAYGVTTGADLVNPSHSSYILGFTKYYGDWFYLYGRYDGQGSHANFYSSASSDVSNAYNLYYKASEAHPQNYHAKGNGSTVRCVFEGETIQDITYMQDMTKSICDATNTGVTTRLRDKRGRGNGSSAEDDSYGVIKAKDGNCWMTENFDLYNMTGDNAIKAEDSDFASGTYEIPASSNWSGNQYAVPLVHQATNAGYTDQVYYNWTAAVALTNGSTTAQQDQSVCPKGWQLPINGANTVNKTYAKLMNAYGVTTGPNLVNPAHASYVLGFRYFGIWGPYADSEYEQGIEARFWSSYPSDVGNAYVMYYYTTGMNLQRSNYKGDGASIRCVNRG